MEYNIPLRNKNKIIVEYAIVSKEDYDLINKYKWCKTNNYIASRINNKNWYLHKYIMEIILNNTFDTHNNCIDHIDNNTLNNRRDNLRIVSHSENNHNKEKKLNTSSKFKGVCWIKNKNKWRVSIKINKKSKSAYYINEIHAAHHYNLWCQEYNFYTSKLNKINKEDIEDFILYVSRIKIGNNIPKHISLTNNKFWVRINSEHIGYFETLLEAVVIRNFKLKQIENQKQDKLKLIPIKRNINGYAIIDMFNIKKEKVAETIVDDDLYYELIKYKFHLSHNGYVQNSKIGGLLHRFILQCDKKEIIDHINNNPLDNRKVNLRIVSRRQNAQNKSSSPNSTSQYIGVSFDKGRNKWKSYITVNSKYKHLGRFNTEEEAAKVRDEATKKYYKEFGNLNF